MAEYVCDVVTEHELCGCVHHYVRHERIVRCRDCKHAIEHCDTEELDCTHFSQWDYYDAWLDAHGEPFATYCKRLIREDMERHEG